MAQIQVACLHSRKHTTIPMLPGSDFGGCIRADRVAITFASLTIAPLYQQCLCTKMQRGFSSNTGFNIKQAKQLYYQL